MFSAKFGELTKAMPRAHVFMWISQITFPLMLLVPAHIISGQTGPLEYPHPWLPYAMLAVAVISFLATFMPFLTLSDGWIRKSLTGEPDLRAMATTKRPQYLDETLLKNLQELPEPELRVFKVLQESLGRRVILWSVATTIALPGFLLAVLSGQSGIYLPFGAVALVRLVTLKPDFNRLLARIEMIADGTGPV